MTVAFIPVRGGSKSVPRKNIRPLGGLPLVHWVVQAALGSDVIDHVYVSSDSEEILDVAARVGSPRLRPIRRAAEFCTDVASTESALLDFAERYEFDRVVLIQATSPLTRSEDLTGALSRLEVTGATSVVSVTRERRFLWRELPRELIEPKNYDPLNRPRRQDWNGELVENGAFYITSRDALLRSRCRVSGTITFWEMPPDTAIELDEETDWQLIEARLASRRKESTPSTAPQIRMVVTDVDGVLTDGGMYYGPSGEVMKKFNTRDGQGLAMLREAGIAVAIVTRETSDSVAARARKLGVDEVFMGATDKLQVVSALAQRHGLTLSEVAYIGDDVHDVDVMRRVGIAACPRDAEAQAQAVATYRCTRDGGAGCVRELAEHIIAQGRR